MTASHQTTAEELLFNGDEKEAMVFYTRLMVEEPHRADFWLIQILYLLGQSQWTEADVWLSRALGQFPGGGPEWPALRAMMHSLDGRDPGAAARLDSMAEEHPESWVVLLCLGMTRAGPRGKGRGFAPLLDDAIRTIPREAWPLFLLVGGALEARGLLAPAVGCFVRAWRIRDDCAYAHYRAAVALNALGRAAQAQSELTSAALLAGENMRLQKKIMLVQPKSLWERLMEVFWG